MVALLLLMWGVISIICALCVGALTADRDVILDQEDHDA